MEGLYTNNAAQWPRDSSFVVQTSLRNSDGIIPNGAPNAGGGK